MMRHLAGALLLIAWAGPACADEVVETRTLRGAFAPAAGSGAVALTVENVFGSIRVEAHSGTGIEWVASETVRARSREKLARSREEVELTSTESDRELRLIVEGPFRCERPRRLDLGYVVVYDLEIRVPVDTDLDVSTVNEGEVVVIGVRGRFDVSNVNGGVELSQVAGSGEVTTVNGSLRVRFAENPREDWRFETINGPVELTFRPGLSADLDFATMNGEAWTDFEVQPLATEPTVEESRDGSRRIIRLQRVSTVRVAAGGPRLSCKTLNGDILIRKARNGATEEAS